ncbi:MAG: TolC family protein [Verrucomicrobiales bacterium]|nr:TolC family protein [Verrucomicrobiales bacterium]
MKRFLNVLALATLVGGGMGLAAPVALEKLVAETVATHPEVQFYESQIAVAHGEGRDSTTLQNPQLQTSIGTWRVKDLVGGGLSDGPAWTVTLSQTFEWPGRMALRRAIAEKDVELARLGLEEMKLKLAGDVRMAAWRVVAAQQRVRAAAEVAQRFQSLADVLLQRDPAGAAPRLEAQLIRGTALTLGVQATSARREEREARFLLNQLRGAAPEEAVEISTNSPEMGESLNMERMLSLARESNFALRARMVEVEQQGFEVKLARHERWPSITVAPYYQHQRTETREQQYGLGISLPLPVWNRNKGKIEAAEARRVQAEALLRAEVRKLEQEVASHVSACQVYLEELAKWPPDTLAAFKASAEEADQHYRLGALDVSTYTALQTQYLESVNAVLDSQLGAIEARAQLEQLIGKPMAEVGGASGK